MAQDQCLKRSPVGRHRPARHFAQLTAASLEAINGVSFEATGSEFVCLVGPSGCGKTTTLRIVLGLDLDFEGSVTVRPAAWRRCFRNRDCCRGAACATISGWRWATAREQTVPSLMADLDLAGMEALFPTELSLGLARRVAIARAFAVEPSLLVLDEPFVSLDEATAARTRRLLMDVWRSRPTCALMVTHNLAEAVELADRIVVLSPRPGPRARRVPGRCPASGS
jgi:NitT/TauT family transport system ATP-binding protein